MVFMFFDSYEKYVCVMIIDGQTESQVSRHVEHFNTVILLDNINVINVKLHDGITRWAWPYVKATAVSNIFNWKFHVLIVKE